MTNIRSFLGAAGVAAVAALGMSTAALAADEGDKFGYSITISGTSDYIFRGISLTQSEPAFQPFIEFTYGNPNLTWYFDLWGSNINAGKAYEPYELDLYAGVRPVTGPVSWDLGVLYYSYPSAPVRGGDYVEFKVAATISPITNLTLTAIGFMTPDQGKNTPLTETGELDVAYTLPQVGIFVPTLSGAVGYTNADSQPFGVGWFSGADSYTYWNAGVKLTVDKYFMDFRYWDTSISKNDTIAGGADIANVDSRFVFTAGVNLP
jgi:uncharacterized protein (TIGR02001 family)